MKSKLEMRYEIMSNGCWIWKGVNVKGNYGSIHVKGKNMKVHKFMYELYNGKVPANLELDHKCSNRACVNPDHLEPVLRIVNLRRGAGTKINQTIADKIREEYAKGERTQAEIGKDYGINSRWTSDIINRKCWV